MGTFISSVLENGLVKVELTVRPETAQRLYQLHLSDELRTDGPVNELPEESQEKVVVNTPSNSAEVMPIRSFDELEGNEVALLAALAEWPTNKALPPSRTIVPMVDWQYYSKTGSDDETARASSLRVVMQKMDNKGLFRRRGLKGNTERYLTEEGLKYAEQARVTLYGPEEETKLNHDEPDEDFPDLNAFEPASTLPEPPVSWEEMRNSRGN